MSYLLHRLLCNEEECNSVTMQLNHTSLSLSLSDDDDDEEEEEDEDENNWIYVNWIPVFNLWKNGSWLNKWLT